MIDDILEDSESFEEAYYTLREKTEELQLKVKEYERLHSELNDILHPNGDKPENPSLCDLVSYVEKDLGIERTIKISTYDENNSEIILDCIYSNEYIDGKPTYNLTEYIEERDIKKMSKYIQKCINRVPKEKQTEETLELLKIIFELK